jgi:hypothetical protein
MLPGFFNPLPPTHRIRRNAGNTTNRQQQWAVYGVARVRRGTWSREVCVDPAKGHTGLEPWRGSFTSVGRVRAGIKPCDEVRGSTSELNRALRELCPHGG